MLYIDLDRFKQANDSHGHDMGDQLLCEAARRIRECLREADMVGRLGGDEFAVLLHVHRAEDACIVAEKIHGVLNRPLEVNGHQLRISSSIGIAVYPEHGEDRKQLMRHADAAMYAAKRRGRNQLGLAQLRDFSEDDAPLGA